MRLSDSVDSVKGIGEKTRGLFEKLDIHTVGQLLTWYPRDYETYRAPTAIASLREGETGVIEASVSKITESRTGGKMTILNCEAKDPSGTLLLVWFNQPYLKKSLSMGYRYIFRGKTGKEERTASNGTAKDL